MRRGMVEKRGGGGKEKLAHLYTKLNNKEYSRK